MAVFYKYCDGFGALKILGALELKLPFISEVNDPLEGRPALFYNGKLKKVNESREYKRQDKWGQKGCLLSVSETPNNTVMWAHYAERHKGMVIGLDFDSVFGGRFLRRVKYSKERAKIDLSLKDHGGWGDCLMIKSASWDYENEYRAVLEEGALIEFQKHGLICYRDNAWFLRLRAEMIKEVIFGVHVDSGFLITTRQLIREKLSHVRVLQATVSEQEYDFELKDLDEIARQKEIREKNAVFERRIRINRKDSIKFNLILNFRSQSRIKSYAAALKDIINEYGCEAFIKTKSGWINATSLVDFMDFRMGREEKVSIFLLGKKREMLKEKLIKFFKEIFNTATN